MKYSKVMSRRTMLRGAGTVAIGLPFLDEMRSRSVWAAEPEPPARAITVFFGEGCPGSVQSQHLAGFTGPFEPLGIHAEKLGFCRGLRFPDEHHFGGGAGVFTGARQRGGGGAGTQGPSIDQVMISELYGGGLPPGVLGTTAMGLVGSYTPGNGAPPVRYVKCWNDDGTPATIPRLNPGDLFNSVFGNLGGGEPSPEDEKSERRLRSVLDSVLDQYKHYTSEASNLGASSRARLSDHLDRVREFEQQAFGDFTVSCTVPPEPGNLPLVGGQNHAPGITYDVEEFSAVWRLMADIYALGIKCDVIRFGNAHFLNVGDRINFQGDYHYGGELVHHFDDYRDTQGENGVNNRVNHELFHAWNNSGSPIEADHHLHFYMRELAYLLSALDDPEYRDENDGTLLDNALVLISTELSEPGPHRSRDVFHAYSSANGRLKTGEMITAGNDPGWRPASDFYNTILESYGIDRRMGTGGYDQVSSVLV